MTAKRRRRSHATVVSLIQGVEPLLIERIRPIALRSVDDIDSRDADNPLLVTCYVDELYDHFLELELQFRVSSHYMAGQRFVDASMRSILVDSLVRGACLVDAVLHKLHYSRINRCSWILC
jgi:hypothetical protein